VTDEIAIDFDVLAYHAGRVERVAADVALAQNAASSINLGGGAFGLMCAFLVLPTTIVSSAAQLTLMSAKNLVDRSAREIKAVAKDFTLLEEDIISEIDDLQSELENAE